MITVLGNKLSVNDLRHVPVVRPERAGRRWQGIQHHALAVAVLDSLQARGIAVTRQQWAVDKTGSSLVAGIQVNFPSFYKIPLIEGMQYSLGLRHDNAMHRALTFAVGTQVLVCLNGVITGLHVLCRKHTNRINLQEEVNSGIARFIEEARKVKNVIDQLKATRITERRADHLLMESGRQRLIPWSHVGQVHDEYRNPTHREFAEPTGWGLYNSFNHIVKKSNPDRQLHALNRFREIVLN